MWNAYELENYMTRVQSAVAYDALPDIFYVWDTPDLEVFSANDKLYCLDSAYEDFKTELPENMCRNFTFDGHLYGIPLNYNMAVLYANRSATTRSR